MGRSPKEAIKVEVHNSHGVDAVHSMEGHNAGQQQNNRYIGSRDFLGLAFCHIIFGVAKMEGGNRGSFHPLFDEQLNVSQA